MGSSCNNNNYQLNYLLCSLVIMQDLSNDYLVSLDVSNFEHPVNSSEFELVRQAMIARESGNATMEVWLPIQREVRVWLGGGGGQSGVLLTYLSLSFSVVQESYILTNVTYYYAPVEGTSFR